MWKLTKISTDDELYIQPEKNVITIGKQGDFILLGDTSISRNHGTLTQSKGKLFVTDLSKYGTYLNEGIPSKKRIEAQTPVEVKVGDTIAFGICQNHWVVEKSTLNTVSTSLSLAERKALKALLLKTNVNLQDSFDASTTHLTIDVLSVTVKVLHAMMKHIPIVSTKFWIQFYENLKNCKVCPKAEDFKPRIDNEILRNLNYKADRTKIFAGKIFMFVNKAQKENYAKCIELGGGKTKDLTKTMSKAVLIRDSAICVLYNPNSQSQNCSQATNDLFEYVLNNNRRLIPEHEIGMAIVMNSTEKYCNPKHKLISEIIPDSERKTSVGTELVPETPNITSPLKSTDKDFLVLKANTATIELFDSDDELFSAVEIPENQNKSKSLENDDEMNSKPVSSTSGKRKATPSPKGQRKTRKIQEVVEANVSRTRSTRSSTSNVSTKELSFEAVPPRRSTRNHLSPEAVEASETFSEDKISKPKIPITSTQSSDPQPLEINESEIFNSEKIKTAETKKRRVMEADDSDDDNFFAMPARKSQKIAEEKQTIIEKPEEFISRSSRTLNVTEPVQEIAKKPKNRGKLLLLEDCDEKNFFNFGKKPAKLSKPNEDDNDDFNFDNSRTQTKKKMTKTETSSVSSSTLAMKPVQIKEIKEVPEYKIEPIKLTMDGWLCSSMRKIKLEDNSDVKKENHSDLDDHEWINSIKGSFKVEKLDSSTFIRTKSFANVSNSTSNTSSIGNSTLGGKNFKKFVKSYNYKPQTHVITTISYHLDCA
ncbi:NBN family protein [Megaselia abdita]